MSDPFCLKNDAHPPGALALAETWNRARGPLPKVVKLSRARCRLMLRALATDGDLEMHERAMRAFAAHRFNLDNGYGVDTYCRHHEKWLDRAEAAPAPVPTRDDFVARIQREHPHLSESEIREHYGIGG